MKKLISCLFVSLLVLAIYTSSSFACSWGNEGSAFLTNANSSKTVYFNPTSSGTHKIRAWASYGGMIFPAQLALSWAYDYDLSTWYSMETGIPVPDENWGTVERDLESDGDKVFKAFFQKNTSSVSTYVDWEFCTD